MRRFVRLQFSPFFEGDRIALLVVLDLGHEASDQRQTSAAGGFQVFVGTAIGDLLGAEAGAFVADPGPKKLGAQLALHLHFPGRVESVAVPDGVGDRFLQGHANPEQVVLAPTEVGQFIDHFLDQGMLRIKRARQRTIDRVCRLAGRHRGLLPGDQCHAVGGRQQFGGVILRDSDSCVEFNSARRQIRLRRIADAFHPHRQGPLEHRQCIGLAIFDLEDIV